ncbi:MAG: hypothetical protein NC305_08485 [Lachnospiraceae bacterium]|nr:hypothetical protein [Butyrivibrio sp.]MCM1343400.1 hypothetical protein [Muribaculaceae bacterium]MCM1410569.1 hypothetical protein [Lachnospiraceae bacterium]
MSNPGVILLSETKTACGRFIIEDNLGEAIHLHLNDIRVDITVNDLEQLAVQCINILDSFISLPGFSCNELDPIFLSQVSYMLPDLQGVQKRIVELDKFKIQVRNKCGIPVNRKMKDSRVLKALQGNSREDDNFLQQENYIFQNNAERTFDNLSVIKEEGYDPDKGMVVTFNGQNFIRDGQHRIAVLLFLGRNGSIETLDLSFKGEKYSLSEHPAVQFFLCWNLEKVKRIFWAVSKRIWQKRYQVMRLFFRIIYSIG